MEKLKVGTYIHTTRDKIIIHKISGYTKTSDVLYSFDDEKAKYWDSYESIFRYLKRHGFKYMPPEWD